MFHLRGKGDVQVKNMHFVVEFFDIGLLQFKQHPYLSVSPDGIALILFKGKKVFACVKMKTRVAWRRIEDVENKVSKH